MTGGSAGELVLLGAEYSVKALFPDKEPTDHEVRGKQLFSIQPPHLNTSSGNKNTSQAGVGDDNYDDRILSNVPTILSRNQAKMNCFWIRL